MKSDREITCAIFDVAGMQALNDQRGYEFGDQLLQDLETELNSAFDSYFLTRLSDDEFLVSRAGDAADFNSKAQAFAQKFRDRFAIEVTWGLGTGMTTSEAKSAAMVHLFEKRRGVHGS